MTNKPKAIGTNAETGVARWLVANGWPHAERRALKGEHDEGDITGTPGLCWEVKGGGKARTAHDLLITTWLYDTEKERANAGADIGILVVARPGYGPKRAGNWWAIVPSHVVAYLAEAAAELSDYVGVPNPPVRMLLNDVVALLRWAGYGEPVPLPEVAP